MAFVPEYGTGFEAGSIEIVPAVDRNSYADVDDDYKKTGTYALALAAPAGGGDAHIRIATSGSSKEIGAWIRPNLDDGYDSLQVILGDGKVIEIQRGSTNHFWDAYVDGSKVADGSIETANAVFTRVALSVTIADAGGIRTWIDGIADISYDGDTKPGTSSDISYVEIYARWAAAGGYYNHARWDDLVFGSGSDLEQAPDCRFEGIMPNGDIETEWTPSTPGTHYTLVDEIPPSDTDYVSTTGSAARDLYDMSSWSGSGKEVQFLVQWHRAKKEAATTDKLKQLIKSGSTESESSAQSLTTAYTYIHRIVEDDPATGLPWTADAVNAVQSGHKSDIT